jgi:hypothetical protein
MDVRETKKLGAGSYIYPTYMRVACLLGLTAATIAAQQVDQIRVGAHLNTPPQPHMSTPDGYNMAARSQS